MQLGESLMKNSCRLFSSLLFFRSFDFDRARHLRPLRPKFWIARSAHPKPSSLNPGGPPDSVYVADDSTRMLTYYSTRMVSFSGSTIVDRHALLVGESIYTNTYGNMPSEVRVHNCKTSFTLVQQRVTSWRWYGNGRG